MKGIGARRPPFRVAFRRYPRLRRKYGEFSRFHELLLALVSDDFALGMDVLRLVLRKAENGAAAAGDALADFPEELFPRLLAELERDKKLTLALFREPNAGAGLEGARRLLIFCAAEGRFSPLFLLYDALCRALAEDGAARARLLRAAIVNCTGGVSRADFARFYERCAALTDAFSRFALCKKLKALAPGFLRAYAFDEGAPLLSVALAGLRYGDTAAFAALREGDALLLLREPENAFDPFAVAVCDAALRRLAYIPRAQNRELAAAMDGGERFRAVVARIDRRARFPLAEVDIFG